MQKNNRKTSARATTPPTTPPAMAPVLVPEELRFWGAVVGTTTPIVVDCPLVTNTDDTTILIPLGVLERLATDAIDTLETLATLARLAADCVD
jgi:hypothetical protein